MDSNFKFLAKEFQLLFNLAQSAEKYIYQDPNAALYKLRLMGEKMIELIFGVHQIEFPTENTTFKKLQVLADEGILEDKTLNFFHTVRKSGNRAIHDGQIGDDSAMTLLYSMFKLSKWFYETYSVDLTDIGSFRFHPLENVDIEKDFKTLEKEYQELEVKFNSLLADREIGQLNKKKSREIKKRSERAARKIEMTEAETRQLIDAQLRAAGWEADTPLLNYKLQKTLPEKGRNMAIAEWKVGPKWADYALFIGTELFGIVEAKKYAQDISTDLRQSKIYAQHAEENKSLQLLGQWGDYHVPFLFSTNGRKYLKQLETKSGIWFLDVRKFHNQARSLKGWYSPEGLKKLWEQNIQTAEQKLKNNAPDYLMDNTGLNLREYQIKAIKKVEETILQKSHKKRILIAMATGTGKTRTIIGLAYRLVQSNRFKRILFLVDRRLLAQQASDHFKDNKIEDLKTFSDIYDVKELKELTPELDTRLHFATVQSMVKRLFFSDDDREILPIDTYDCIIVDEAHRGYLLDREMDETELEIKDQNDYISKYRMALDYFDATAIGLTATPALHTTEIFGHPVFTYSYREAVIDGFLIDHEPPYIIKTKLSEEGIIWEKGDKPKIYSKEENEIVELNELEDELAIFIDGFNKQVITENFNRTVLEQLVQEIDPDGDEKTLIFAATDEHADLVVKLMKEEYRKIGVEVYDDAIQKITGKSYNPIEQVRRYKNEKYPTIAVTVDLLTTGVDVPPICNLVFLRRIKSRILYEQMMGRATRRCDEINKEVFRIYDAVKIYETLQDYMQMKPVAVNPKATFKQLVEELHHIENKDRLKRQIEQIIAKFQRKRRLLENNNLEQFKYQTEGKTPEQFFDFIKDAAQNGSIEKIKQYKGIWSFLDELKPSPAFQFVSEHQDEFKGMERGYGKDQKPNDYLLEFEQYIKENINKIAALQIICTRPQELDRNSLKELQLELNKQGFYTRAINAAWKETKNQDIAADIISYIRTLALGDALVSHEERIRKAVEKVRAMKNWNKIQLKWIERFEKQLLQETILQKEDLNREPFKIDGGFDRLNKIFNSELDQVIEVINENLYITA
jgi:type I restriction enzyme R subunit